GAAAFQPTVPARISKKPPRLIIPGQQNSREQVVPDLSRSSERLARIARRRREEDKDTQQVLKRQYANREELGGVISIDPMQGGIVQTLPDRERFTFSAQSTIPIVTGRRYVQNAPGGIPYD